MEPQPAFKKQKPSSVKQESVLQDHVRDNDIGKLIPSLQEAMDKKEWDTIKYLLEDTMYLINTDTGGQTQFLDLMSRFLLGPALNIIVRRLTDSLDKNYKIYCTNDKGVSTEEEDSVITLEEVLFQVLASIAYMDNADEPDKTSKDSEEKKDDKTSKDSEEKKDDKTSKDSEKKKDVPACVSKALFVGTFRDKISETDFNEKDETLSNMIKKTDFYTKRIVEFASEEHLMIPLDNMTGGQEEVDTMRKTFETTFMRIFKKVLIPATWLILSINLRHTGKPTMTLTECQEMADKVGITPTMLQMALWFLHYRVGILLYYPEVDGFDEIIILDIQV